MHISIEDQELFKSCEGLRTPSLNIWIGGGVEVNKGPKDFHLGGGAFCTEALAKNCICKISESMLTRICPWCVEEIAEISGQSKITTIIQEIRVRGRLRLIPRCW